MTDDAELLRTFATTGDGEAFAELVQRHIDLVYSAAARQLGGDVEHAQEATTAAFADLARKARSIQKRGTLACWLYAGARSAAASRRNAGRPQAASSGSQEQLAWALDDAMHDLDDRDREAVLLRYFLRQDLIAVGMALGLDENATRMRTSRALEKLRAFLGRRGAAVSNAELLTALADRAVQPAPAGLAAAISVSIASIGKGGRSVAGAGGSIRLGRPGICMLGVVVAATAILLVWQHFQIGKLKAERAALWQEAEQAGRLRAENERLSKLKQNSAELERLRKERIELARLRVEVERLRKAAAANTNIIKELQVARATADAAQAEAARIAAEAEAQRISVNTANALSILGLAARTYASENDGLMPTNSAMLRLHLEPEEMPGGLQIENFEFVPHARQIKETETDLILLRERTARQRPDGKWVRAYWLVDGSSVEQASNDGNFEAWERLHTANIPAAR